jgi:hypothetical protein
MPYKCPGCEEPMRSDDIPSGAFKALRGVAAPKLTFVHKCGTPIEIAGPSRQAIADRLWGHLSMSGGVLDREDQIDELNALSKKRGKTAADRSRIKHIKIFLENFDLVHYHYYPDPPP